MDPVTILSFAGTTSRILSSVSTTLHRFIQDTKQVDKTVEALFHEMSSLQGSIDAIGSVLQKPSKQDITEDDRDNDLWRSVNRSLLECRKTLETLRSSW